MWLYNDVEFTEDMIGDNVGFVYLIENKVTGKKYIGKKHFHSVTTRKPKKGKVRKRKVKKQSNWKDYFGSNNELMKDVESIGKDSFRRTILHLCRTKGETSYLELREQIDRRVLESTDYYNDQIYVRIHRSHLKFTLDSKEV